MTTDTTDKAATVPAWHVLATDAEQLKRPEWHNQSGRGAGAGNVVAWATALRELAAGPLFSAIQGQCDLERARACAAKLARSMRVSGRHVSEATIDDGTGAGVLAVLQWRNGEDMPGADQGAAGVCWRAVVASMSADGLGDTVPLFDMTADGLAGSSLPLPGQHEDRQDKATRLVYERTRAKRPALLARRIEHLKATRGGRGKRAEAWDKLHRAAVGLLAGQCADEAASAAGFTGGNGTHATPGDRLRQAARRLGFKFQFDARMSGRGQAARLSHAMGAGLPASYTASLSARPSESLPIDDRWAAPSPRRQAKGEARAKVRKARAARVAIWQPKRDAKRLQREREQRRALKVAGVFASGPLAPSTVRDGLARGVVRFRSHGRLIVG
jgi:hypothetical protein